MQQQPQPDELPVEQTDNRPRPDDGPQDLPQEPGSRLPEQSA